ncbi:5-formyltetrahydrofolate cyclo-ligase [Ostreiculturibacter nitratireducens]|uniref:5-formyltetrahydrofolate cyclo-ligase n=1 Tax=Ostreiculturibacter nitratireducens TaxID=3075226 RepID=UPI003CCC48A2
MNLELSDTMTELSLTEQKTEARRLAFAARKVAHAAGQGRAAERLAEVLAPYAGKPLAGYMPMRTEIDPLPAMAAHEGQVGVPVILGAGQALRFREWSATAPMVTGDFGALIPETGNWIDPEVLIVPLVAFDRRGYRLGYGGGFYDRTLEGLKALHPVVAIGFAFGAQELPEVPIEPTDQRLDFIVTESEVLSF